MSQDLAYICAGGPGSVAKTTCNPAPTGFSKPPTSSQAHLPLSPTDEPFSAPKEMGIRGGAGWWETAGLVPESWQKALSFIPMPFDT